MGGVGLINFLIVPTIYDDYVNGKYISTNVEIKKSATPKLYDQVKSIFNQQFFFYPIILEVNDEYVNTDDKNNPYFIVNNINMNGIRGLLVPYGEFSINDDDSAIRYIRIPYGEHVDAVISITYNTSNETIFVCNEASK